MTASRAYVNSEPQAHATAQRGQLPFTLISGDVIVFGGPKRLAFHGIPQTRPETLPEGCGLKEGRINITFRQLDDR